MFESLLDSKLKKKTLAVFFAFPQRSFYVNELREIIGSGSNRVPSVLRELEKKRILRSIRKKRKKYYQIDSHISWYEELKTLVSDVKVPKSDLASRRLKKLKSAKLILLTGIFVGEPSVEVDFLIVGKRPTQRTLDRVISDLEGWTGQSIAFSIMDLEEFEQRKLMNDRFIRDILDNDHIEVRNKLKKKKKK